MKTFNKPQGPKKPRKDKVVKEKPTTSRRKPVPVTNEIRKKRAGVMKTFLNYFDTTEKRNVIQKESRSGNINTVGIHVSESKLSPIAMFMTHESRMIILKSTFPNLNTMPVLDNRIKELLTDEGFELGIDFLRNLESLHDEDQYWEKEGLSEAGLKYVSEIVQEFC